MVILSNYSTGFVVKHVSWQTGTVVWNIARLY